MDISWLYQQHPPNQPLHKTITEICSPLLVPLSLHYSHHEISPPSAPRTQRKSHGLDPFVCGSNEQNPSENLTHKTAPDCATKSTLVGISNKNIFIFNYHFLKCFRYFLKCVFSRGENVIFSMFPSQISHEQDSALRGQLLPLHLPN